MKYQTQLKQKEQAQRRYVRIAEYVEKHPELSQKEVGEHFGVTDQIVRKALKNGRV